MKFNQWFQILFDFLVNEKSSFRNLFAVKNKIVIIYDPADEIISLLASAYTGTLYLFFDLYQEIKRGETNIKIHNEKLGLLETIKSFATKTSSDFARPDRLFSEIEPLISKDTVKKLHSTLERVFNFVRVVDVNSRMEESLTIRRTISGKSNLKDIALDITNILKNSSNFEGSFDYNDKEGHMMHAFNQEANGLSDIIIKFVKFMHRFEVCSMSIFDIYCQKSNDIKIIKLFLWNLYFMDFITKIDCQFNNQSKFDVKAIQQGLLNSNRQFRTKPSNIL